MQSCIAHQVKYGPWVAPALEGHPDQAGLPAGPCGTPRIAASGLYAFSWITITRMLRLDAGFGPYLIRAAGRGLSDAAKVLLFVVSARGCGTELLGHAHLHRQKTKTPDNLLGFGSNADRLCGVDPLLPAPAANGSKRKLLAMTPLPPASGLSCNL